MLAVALSTQVHAQQNHGIDCLSCQASYPGKLELAEAIADVVGAVPADVIVNDGDLPGTYRVHLPDDSMFSIAPVGLMFRHQNMLQRRVSNTEDGGLHLRTQTRLELQLRSAVHREEDVIGELLRLGWNNFYWFRHGMEVEAPDGERYCLQPDMRIFQQTAPGAIDITQDADGNLVIRHTDGIRQRLHACAHDQQQLRDRVRTQLHQELGMDSNGIISVTVNGQVVRYRLHARLRWSDMPDAPGFFNEAGRLYLRYQDGWEQEIIQLD